MANFYVSGNEVYEDRGDPRNNRLVLRAMADGRLVEGPGLGGEALRLVQAVPLHVIGIAKMNARGTTWACSCGYRPGLAEQNCRKCGRPKSMRADDGDN